MAELPTPFIMGWEEWVALPELGLPAIKAKVDTGARTSALHAFLIEPFGTAASPMVRFGVHPIPGRDDIEITCSAPVVDRRDVTSSNGEKETRVFIKTAIEIGGRLWEIEIGLTNRESMAYRMLIGRQAILDDMMVDPAASFRQPRLSYRLYRHVPAHDLVRRALRIALLSETPAAASNRRLAAAAEARGHVLECLDLARLRLTFEDQVPGVALDGAALAHYDAVIPRIGLRHGAFGAALVRQLELMGAYAVNPGDALDRRANPLAVVQALTQAGVANALGAAAAIRGRAHQPEAVATPADDPQAGATALRLLVVGGRVAAVLRRRRAKDFDASGQRLKTERALAERAAAALKLGLAGIDIDDGSGTPQVTAITARPSLSRFAKVTGAHVAEEILALVEARVRSWVHRVDQA